MFTRNFLPYTFIVGRVFFNLFVWVVFFADSPSSLQSKSCSDVIRHRIQHARYWFWFLYSLWICASNGHHNKQVGTSTTFWLLWSTRCKWNYFPRIRLFRPTYGNPESTAWNPESKAEEFRKFITNYSRIRVLFNGWMNEHFKDIYSMWTVRYS